MEATVVWRRTCAVLALVAATALGPAKVAHADNTVRHKQWHLDALRIGDAHKLSTGQGVVVAVVDQGVRGDHPDLAGQVLDGIDLASGSNDRGKTDRANHGTGVAGLIAAKGGGSSRALGIAPDAKILPVKVLVGGLGGGNPEQGIRWAADHGAKVINISICQNHVTPRMREAVRHALSKDVVVVASAGNTATDQEVCSPASIPGVVAVGAVDQAGTRWSGSVTGRHLVLTAPGTEIYTLANAKHDGSPGGYLLVPGGTSASAPIVAGTAALVRARFPDLKAPDVINRLIRTAQDAGPPGRDDEYGFGRLDPVAALTADVPGVSANPLGEPTSTPDPGAEPVSAGVAKDVLVAAAVVAGASLAVLAALGVLVVVVLVRRRRSRRARW